VFFVHREVDTAVEAKEAIQAKAVHIPEAADIEDPPQVDIPEAGSPAVGGIAARIPEAHTPAADIEDPLEQDIGAATTAADIRIRERPTAATTAADITDILLIMVVIMAAGVVTGAAGTAGHTTGTRLVGTGSARGGIPIVTLTIIRTPILQIIRTHIHIPPIRLRIYRLLNIANRSNPTGTIARIRRVIFRMLKVAPVDGPK
jgi:hypothetical protein